jgi:DNA polymerase-3 subunit delta'
MGFRDIVGQERAIRLLQRSKDGPAHAFLFHGPEGVGKRSAAVTFAKLLFCETKGSDSCDRCGPCRKVDRGTHPDFVVVEPEENKIRIETIRAVVQEVEKKPFEADRKIFLLDRADRMTDSAANALLKRLEEPPGAAFFILVTPNPDAVPPTIRSRCRSVPFVRLHSETLRGLLRARLPERAEREDLWISLARGMPGRLIRFDLDREEPVREEMIRLLEEVPDFTPPNLLEHSKRLGEKKEERDVRIGYLLEIVRDLILLKLGGDPNGMLNLDVAERLRRLADRFPEEALFECFEVLRGVERVRDLNPNPTLLWDSTLIQIAQAVRPL